MIKRYRKKPVVVEAVKFTRENWCVVYAFGGGKIHNLSIPRCPEGIATCCIPTLEGTHVAREGDYIIKGVKGEFYPCKPDIFEQTYEEEST